MMGEVDCSIYSIPLNPPHRNYLPTINDMFSVVNYDLSMVYIMIVLESMDSVCGCAKYEGPTIAFWYKRMMIEM